MLIQDGLEHNGKCRPDKIALICERRRFTYAAVDAMANRFAHALIARGLKRGDRVGIYLDNSVEAVIGIYGILKAGGTFVVVNQSTKVDKLSFILRNCQAVGLLTGRNAFAHGTAGKLLSECRDLSFFVTTGSDSTEGTHVCSFDSIQTGFSSEEPSISTIDLDIACLVYTSGSTGEPKGVICDHSSMVFVSNSVMSYLENVESDVILNVLPLSASYGLYQVLMTFTFGGTLVLENSFAYPVAILQRIAEEGVTGFAGVPTMYSVLVQMDLRGFDLSSLRYITNAAAALPPSHIEQLITKLPGVRIYSMYGQTETKRTLYLPPSQLRNRLDSVGIAIPGTEVWIEGPDGSRLGPNEVGELVVRGRHVMRGYWQDPQATAARFRPGTVPGERIYYTGDLFRTDEEGYFYFVARKDDVIKTRGEKVAPNEIENILHRIPGVLEAVVLGVPDDTLGEAVKVVLVVDKVFGLNHHDVLTYLRSRVEDYAMPKYIEFRDELPKTSSGKLLRRLLR
ncbi:MAG: AMP-binding protein [Acidobacteriaceae bacterium]|nr:AMP-binding protein [Acidobacteriaceae bacterium]